MPGGKKPIPQGSANDQKQYEHVKASELKSGKSEADAKRIAGATVNKRRSAEGRTKSK